MVAYYNEHDPHAAQWLRNLIAAGYIAPGEVDERDIRDVAPDELAGFAQCHFFAGIGVWSYALRKAGWPDDRPVWTGSCPCQSFSAAGSGKGFADERHLWPAWFHLIEERRPAIVFGEQVGAAVRHGWLDLVQSDLEGIDYACGAINFPSAGIGAPHIRQRLWFVAEGMDNATGARRKIAGRNSVARSSANDFAGGSEIVELANANGRDLCDGKLQRSGELRQFAQDSRAVLLANAESIGLQRRQDDGDTGRRQRSSGQGREAGELEHAAGDGRDEGRPSSGERGVERGCGAGELGDANSSGLEGWSLSERERADKRPVGAPSDLVRPGPVNGFWRDADWIGCTDGKWRPIEPESFPLVNGSAFRVGSGSPYEGKSRAKMLRGYGNAINAESARAFIDAFLSRKETE